jgi:hypothetical protein
VVGPAVRQGHPVGQVGRLDRELRRQVHSSLADGERGLVAAVELAALDAHRPGRAALLAKHEAGTRGRVVVAAGRDGEADDAQRLREPLEDGAVAGGELVAVLELDAELAAPVAGVEMAVPVSM